MDYFYVVTNPQKDKEFRVTNRIKCYLEEHGRRCEIGIACVGKDYNYTNADSIPEETQCILVIGGDGTLIQAARDTQVRQIPLLGINLGTLGYLAEIEENNLEHALDCLMKDQYSVEERMMLQGRVYKQGQLVDEGYSLNDIVISRHGALKIIQYQLVVNEEHLNDYAADGIIVATPTGSTGYSLSAGGPIVSPSAFLTILTPICPHTLNTRSIVLSDKDKIRVEIGAERNVSGDGVLVTFDGVQGPLIGSGDYVEVEKAKHVTKIVKISHVSFLEVLRNKMRDN